MQQYLVHSPPTTSGRAMQASLQCWEQAHTACLMLHCRTVHGWTFGSAWQQLAAGGLELHMPS